MPAPATITEGLRVLPAELVEFMMVSIHLVNDGSLPKSAYAGN